MAGDSEFQCYATKRAGSGRLGRQVELRLYDDRVEVVTPSMIGRATSAIRYEEITGVIASLPRVGYAVVRVESTGGRKLSVVGLARGDAEKARDEINARVARIKGGARPAAALGVAEELARLAELRASGDLSDEEFEIAKRAVLKASSG